MFAGLLFHRFGHNITDIGIPLVGDDTLGVIIQLLLTVSDTFLHMGFQTGRNIQCLQRLLVALKYFDSVPAQVAIVHLALDRLLYAGNGVFHSAGEYMGQFPGPVGLGQCHGLLGRFHAALTLQCTHFHYLTAKCAPQLDDVDDIAVFLNQIHHVYRHHHRYAQLNELSC